MSDISNVLKSRLDINQQEFQRLAPYAVSSLHTKGRDHPEEEHPHRTCFQRDRDRIIHSSAFRRLEAKTQVFLDSGSDYYRTRLTHTIEVSLIARTMARILAVNEDLAEAVAMAHDLGHPPYGHCGEKVLDTLMADHGGFEHNRHSLRVVEFLEHPYPSFRGLNLCFETRECMAKHETHYDRPEINQRFGSGQGPIEGQIADLADSIAYNSHDLDDALVCGLIQENELDEIDLYQEIKERVEKAYPQAHKFARQLRCAKALIDLLAMDAMHEAARRIEALNPTSVDDIRTADQKMIALSDTRQSQLEQLQKFLLSRVYNHPLVAQAQDTAGLQMTYLFNRYVEDPKLLPTRYQGRLDQQSLQSVICDYIAGMTDRFCKSQYKQMMEKPD